ncbi:helix-turn-helix domain-containing protein [Salinirubellus salinus]|uniref:Helix-turn-helix domain-containing protein n=1 Tax=Salinirubellus salinus TaxID=1364945 RepID=A0A9E7R2W2_9EURY|nr:helix-turn-helix domain-containing protein [Salinirubellus salinus]UWM54562.1 helix-turn-helix domain-containing protein [Salinirubellus salinus]
MSQSESAFVAAQQTESTIDVSRVDDADEMQALLDAFGDADCRAILEATGEEALTAAEISERVDLPKSTAYRKIDTLSELSLVEEQTRIRRSGKHASEFRRVVEDLYVTTTDDGGIELRVSRLARPEQFGVPRPSAY